MVGDRMGLLQLVTQLHKSLPSPCLLPRLVNKYQENPLSFGCIVRLNRL